MQIVGFWRCFIVNTLKQEKNIFWEDVFKSWICFIKTRNSGNVIKNNFHAFPIWYNSELDVKNNKIFIKSWYQLLVTFCKMVDFLYKGCIYSKVSFTTSVYNAV